MPEVCPSYGRRKRGAAAVIGQELGGVDVRIHDDGSRAGMHDLDIPYSADRWGAVDVATATDAESTELWRLINPPGPALDRARSHRWMVSDVEADRIGKKTFVPSFQVCSQTWKPVKMPNSLAKATGERCTKIGPKDLESCMAQGLHEGAVAAIAADHCPRSLRTEPPLEARRPRSLRAEPPAAGTTGSSPWTTPPRS
jgi:hypothetical protein